MSMPQREARGDRSATTPRDIKESRISPQRKHPEEAPIHVHAAKDVGWAARARQRSALRRRRARGIRRRILTLSIAAVTLLGQNASGKFSSVGNSIGS